MWTFVNMHKLSLKIEKQLELFYELNLESNMWQGYYKKDKIHANHRCKNPKQNISKSNTIIWKEEIHHDQIGVFVRL